MSALPHCRPAAWPKSPPHRFASRVRQEPRGCRVAIIGLPDDLGVRLNGGRAGAADGPRAFRAALSCYGVAEPSGWEWPSVFDAGDVIPASGDGPEALHETHRRIEAAAVAILDAGLLPIGIGGGHDLTLPLVRAVSSRNRPLNAVYFDPHLDVREAAGSGMAFRRILDEGLASSVIVHGMKPAVNSREHVEFFQTHGGVVAPADAKPAFDAPGAYVSFDLDVLDASHAPGVSAMNPCGWSIGRAEAAAFEAGRSPHVRGFDIMELNPAHDEQGRTARVAAHLFLTFLRGFAERAP